MSAVLIYKYQKEAIDVKSALKPRKMNKIQSYRALSVKKCTKNAKKLQFSSCMLKR